MLTKLQTLASLYRQLGLRWLIFRLTYAFRLCTGLIRLQMPLYQWADRPLKTWLKEDVPSRPDEYAAWRRQNSPKFFFDDHKIGARSPSPYEWNPQLVVEEADRILNGEIKYFSHEFQKTGFPPDWHNDPVSGIKIDSSKHWSRISDEGETDIKYIWEASRFGFVYTLVRAYALTHDEKYPQAFWKLTRSWAESNPPNAGPNWMDGQELSLRSMAWTFGLYAFINSPSTTSQHIADLTVYIAAHAERIYSNTDFAILTRGNHSITEALGLWMTGLLFPELEDSEKYLSFGKMSLEREARNQIFPDGTYSMYSLNYHRFVLQIYLFAIRLSELNTTIPSLRAAPFGAKHPPSSFWRLLRADEYRPRNDEPDVKFSGSLYRAISSSIDYLSQLIDLETGEMPVYGSNDGALVLPLNSCDFTDYRPLLQLGSFVTQNKRLFESGAWDEDLFWLCGAESLQSKVEAPQQKTQSYPNGGMYVLRNAKSKAVIRCTDFKARPFHADQLHLDLWWDGLNIACDAGTYLYSGDIIWRNGLAHTSVHNTVTIDSKDQMKMVSRFTWTDWAKGKVLQQTENLWQGEHDGYKPVTHKRIVHVLDGDRWLVVDHLNDKPSHHYALHWLIDDVPYTQKENNICLWPALHKYKIQVGLLNGESHFSVVRADPKSTRGWRSKYYGQKQPAISLMLEADQPQVCFWTFFGFESDSVKLMGDMLRINSVEINLLKEYKIS